MSGWNPKYINKVDVKKTASVGCVDFAGHKDMYNAMKSAISKRDDIKNYILFDDQNVSAWLCWNGVDQE